MLQLKLNNDNIYNLLDVSYSREFIMQFNSISEYKAVEREFTDENLSNVEILDRGMVVHKLKNLQLITSQIFMSRDKTVTAYFYCTRGNYVFPNYSEEETLPEDE